MTNSNSDVEYFVSEHNKGLPFSDAVRVGNMLYLSGQLGLGGDGKLVEGGIAAQTQQALESIRTTLERCGSSLEHVVKMTVMLADIGEWADMNKIYVTYFPNHFPARSALGVSGLAFGARVEIECVAVVKG
jgi:2-iminobutanoate/2-iminopropanoate deaminase